VHQAYCFRCQTMRDIKDAEPVALRKGHSATRGTCPVCNGKLFRLGKAA
jgi:hypothetical protein